jgi:hypothetical protein
MGIYDGEWHRSGERCFLKADKYAQIEEWISSCRA